MPGAGVSGLLLLFMSPELAALAPSCPSAIGAGLDASSVRDSADDAVVLSRGARATSPAPSNGASLLSACTGSTDHAGSRSRLVVVAHPHASTVNVAPQYQLQRVLLIPCLRSVGLGGLYPSARACSTRRRRS